MGDDGEEESAVRAEWLRDFKVAVFRAGVSAAFVGFAATTWQGGVTDRELTMTAVVGAVFAVAVASAGWVANGARRD